MPALFCRCVTCVRARALRGKNIRTRSSALIDGVLKIDFPPDTLSQVIHHDVDLTEMKAVLFTHGHDDHFSPSELQYRGSYFVSPPITSALEIFGPRDVIQSVSCSLDPELVSTALHCIEPDRPVSVIGYQVFPFTANHDPSRVCLNYVIKGPDGASLLYASDTGWYPERTWKLLEKFQIDGVIVECTKREEGGYPGHLSVPEVARMRKRLESTGSLRPGAPMIATHFGHLMGLLHDELETLLSIDSIQAAYDGMTIDINPA